MRLPVIRLIFLCVLLQAILIGAPSLCFAQESAPWCSSEQLDLNIGPLGESPSSSARWLVVEIRNIGNTDCRLPPLQVGFPPDGPANDYKFNNTSYQDTSQAAETFRRTSQRLSRGEEAHILIAWTSAPTEVNGLAYDDCETRNTLVAGPIGSNSKPLMEVKNLRIWACDNHFWTSSYRFGPYITAAPISKEWLERVHLREADFTAGDAATRETPVPAGADIRLWSPSDIQYLKGSPGSGYFGIFGLFLTFSSPGFPNCPYRSLRMREPDGQTKIYLNHCEDGPQGRQANSSMKETELLLWIFGLLPEKAGPVEYDVVSEVLRNGKPTLVDDRLSLSIRDPDKPMLPTIDTNLPGCRSAQLKLTAPPVELGSHWNRPRGYPVTGADWFDGRVFEVTNTSAETCLLGGMPQLKFLNPPEITSGSITPLVCRNCATPLFKPREVRWIGLKPNDSAHFIAVRQVSHLAASNFCNVVGGMDMSLGDGPPIRLPFEVSFCAPIRVSAWRAGKYDSDPMNVEYDRKENERLQKWTGVGLTTQSKVMCIDNTKPAAQLPPPGAECERQEFAKNGRPVMSIPKGGIAFGLSSSPANPTVISVWFDNQTDNVRSYYMCCGTSFRDAIDVYDSGGHRLLSKAEQEARKACESGKVIILSCTCSALISIAPHTMQVVNSGNIEDTYLLSPGRYFVVLAKAIREDCDALVKPSAEPANAEPTNAIEIVVQD